MQQIYNRDNVTFIACYYIGFVPVNHSDTFRRLKIGMVYIRALEPQKLDIGYSLKTGDIANLKSGYWFLTLSAGLLELGFSRFFAGLFGLVSHITGGASIRGGAYNRQNTVK